MNVNENEFVNIFRLFCIWYLNFNLFLSYTNNLGDLQILSSIFFPIAMCDI